MIILPDIHGRTFWKDVVKNRENEDIIFLGDYLDPYPHEEISPEDAITNFEEIINFKKNHINNVTLLLGNHDLGPYIAGTKMLACRTDRKNIIYISQLFAENINLFKLGDYRTIDGTVYTFTHAPILKGWGTIHFPDLNPVQIIDSLNTDFINSDTKLYHKLDNVSYFRGGDDFYGSSVWADAREMDINFPEYEGYYMIFGHTQLMKQCISNYWACLDCRAGFELNNGILTKI